MTSSIRVLLSEKFANLRLSFSCMDEWLATTDWLRKQTMNCQCKIFILQLITMSHISLTSLTWLFKKFKPSFKREVRHFFQKIDSICKTVRYNTRDILVFILSSRLNTRPTGLVPMYSVAECSCHTRLGQCEWSLITIRVSVPHNHWDSICKQ